MTEQIPNDLASLGSHKVSLSGHAMMLLSVLTKSTGVAFPDLIETALRGYERAWKESE